MIFPILSISTVSKVTIVYLYLYLADFYDHFNLAGPEELKGLIRESVIGPLQELMSNLNEELKLDKRQVSVEIFMKNLPCSDE